MMLHGKCDYVRNIITRSPKVQHLNVFLLRTSANQTLVGKTLVRKLGPSIATELMKQKLRSALPLSLFLFLSLSPSNIYVPNVIENVPYWLYRKAFYAFFPFFRRFPFHGRPREASKADAQVTSLTIFGNLESTLVHTWLRSRISLIAARPPTSVHLDKLRLPEKSLSECVAALHST